MKKYVFFGDSVTEAHRNKENSSDLGEGFVYLVSKEFNNIKFFNRGISGHRVNDLLKRVNDDVINLKPDVCFIWIGVNDAWIPYFLNQPSSIKSFLGDYEQLIREINEKLSNTEIVLIKPFALHSERATADILRDLEVFRNDCDILARKYKLKVIDIKNEINSQLVLMSADSIFSDGIHPTPLGYEMIKNVISNFIRGNLNDI
jgi:lysophospholipase L1-like esterase